MYGIMNGASISQMQRSVLDFLGKINPHWRSELLIAFDLKMPKSMAADTLHSLLELMLVESKQVGGRLGGSNTIAASTYYYRISEQGNKLLRALEELNTVQ